MKLTTNSQRILAEMVKQDFDDTEAYSDEAQFFDFFAAKQIMKRAELSDEEVEKGVLGSGNDGGCDAIYTLFNNAYVAEDALDDISATKESSIEFVIIQAKRETSFGEDALMKWKTTAGNLLEIGIDDARYAGRYSEDVLAAFALFRDLYVKVLRSTPRLNISFHYATYATEVHPNVTAQADELKAMIHRLFPSSKTTVTVRFWGAEELFLAAQSQAEHKLKLPLAETPINIGTHQDYVALVNLAKYYHFIIDESGSLRKYIFEADVRDYQGHNAVNQDIEHTLETSTGEDFWWLNNGMTLLTDEATLATETRNVLVRIIVPESEDSRDRIILATNNQPIFPNHRCGRMIRFTGKLSCS